VDQRNFEKLNIIKILFSNNQCLHCYQYQNLAQEIMLQKLSPPPLNQLNLHDQFDLLDFLDPLHYPLTLAPLQGNESIKILWVVFSCK